MWCFFLETSHDQDNEAFGLSFFLKYGISLTMFVVSTPLLSLPRFSKCIENLWGGELPRPTTFGGWGSKPKNRGG